MQDLNLVVIAPENDLAPDSATPSTVTLLL